VATFGGSVEFLEILKTVGALGGIASSAFLVYDRLVRSRPYAYLRPSKYSVEVVVKNVTNYVVIVDEIGVSPAVVGLKKNEDTLSILQTIARPWYPTRSNEKAQKVFMLLYPLEERGFGVLRLKHFDAMDDKAKIVIRCSWRNTRKPFPMKRSIKVHTTAGDIRKLSDVALENANRISPELSPE
jgi:hypothetical protein